MGQFVNLVRGGKIPQPQQRKFTAEEWCHSYEAIKHPDTADTRLYEAGQFFHTVLSSIRARLNKIKIDRIPRAVRIRAACGIANREITLVASKLRKNQKTMRGRTIVMNQLVEQTIHLPSGVEVAPDDLLTQTVDNATYPIDFAAIAPQEVLEGEQPDWESRLLVVQKLANVYSVASDLWLDCVWQGHFLERRGRNIVISPPDESAAINYAVGEYRQNLIVASTGIQAAVLWKHSLSEEVKRALTQRPVVVGVDRTRDGNPFILGRQRAHKRDSPPPQLVGRLMASEDYLVRFLDVPFPKVPQLSVRIMAEIWELLYSLVSRTLKDLERREDTFKRALNQSLTVKRADLIGLLCEAMSFDADTAEQCIELITYKPRKTGALWACPLVSLDDERLCIVAGSILYGNFLRTAEALMQLGGLELSEKGELFEIYARDEISEALESSELIHDFEVLKGSLFVGEPREQVDVAFRIGKTILVAEAKCQVFPSDPFEIHNYMERLREGANQIRRKVAALRNDLAAARQALKVPAETPDADVRIVPFVLTNLVIGAGFPIGDIPVVDLVFLRNFLSRGEFDIFSATFPDGTSKPAHVLVFYRNQKEAEANCEQMLLNHPVAAFWKRFARPELRPMPLGGNERLFLKYFEIQYSQDRLVSY